MTSSAIFRVRILENTVRLNQIYFITLQQIMGRQFVHTTNRSITHICQMLGGIIVSRIGKPHSASTIEAHDILTKFLEQ